MDLKLQVKQTQALSQRMIQSAEILQMTSQELNTYINELALENPVIDIVEPPAGNQQKESIEEQQWLNSFRILQGYFRDLGTGGCIHHTAHVGEA